MLARPRKQRRSEVNERIRKLHEAIADKVLANPDLLDGIEDKLEQRYESKMMRYGSYMLWKSILETVNQPDVFKALLLAEDERTANLRRETIFTGVLTEEERTSALQN
ncbi:hypothetical protein MTsDn1_14140 [Alteromonas sp. MTD1]|jgi:hypothetical protein|uniref:hypothetical protein n=1 Tax=Alteromonas sp. MTD1 TaxID=3057962 RepID=UPI0036F2F780